MNLLNDNISLGKVRIKVNDLKKMRDYYVDGLGMQILDETDHSVILGTSKNELLELVSGDFELPFTKFTGLYHFALLLPERSDMIAMIQMLQKNGIEISGAADHLFSEAIYFNDIEGNGIEIYIDRPREQWVILDDGSLPGVSDPLDIDSLLRDFDGRVLTKLPENTVMGHIHLSVSNIPKTRKFYTEILGFEIKTEMPTALFLSKKSYHHHLGMNTWESKGSQPLPDNITGLASYEIRVDNFDDIKHTLVHNYDGEFEVYEDCILLVDPDDINIIIKDSLN